MNTLPELGVGTAPVTKLQRKANRAKGSEAVKDNTHSG